MVDQCTPVIHADKNFCGGVAIALPIVPELFFTNHGPSASQGLSSNSVQMTKIGQRVFELCEHKKVCLWVSRSGAYTLTLLQALSLTTAPWLYHRKVIRVARFFLCCNRSGARGRNMLQWPPDNYNIATPTALP